jgi:predicted kinase
MTEQEFIVTRGLPASGKSTWAKQWVVAAPNRVRVNRDDIREEFYGKDYKQNGDAENKVSEIENNRLHAALRSKKSVVSDNMHLNPRFLKNFHKMAAQYGLKLQHRDFPIDIEEAKRRNANRERVVPPEIIDKIAREQLGPNGEFHYFDGDYTPREFVAPEKPGQLAAGFDLDGTLSNTRGITHFVKGKYRNFDMFHRSSFFTETNPEVEQALRDLQAQGVAVLGTTARGEAYREVTELWLNNKGIHLDNLFMREEGDFRPDYEVKSDMLRDKIKPHYDLAIQYDDNFQAVKAFRDGGINVVVVPGFDEEIPMDQVIKVDNVVARGGCIRCGRPLKNGGIIGPNCAKMS